MNGGLITTYEEALAFLEERIGSGVAHGLDRIRGAMELMTSPHESYPVIHVAGTNGKTTVTRMIERMLDGVGMRVGSYISPHLERIEDRFSLNTETFTPQRFIQAIADVAPFIEMYEKEHDTTLTYFEVTVAAALQAFAAEGVDVAVLEVGLGGRLDATNVVSAEVAIVTSIGMDHMEYLGSTLAEIAAEKVAILDPDSHLVTGPLPAAAEGAITARVAQTGSTWSMTGREFRVGEASRAVGGWQVAIDGIFSTYDDIFLPLHGRHQVDNLATAVAACERFFGEALDAELVRGAVARVASAGRIEVVQRRPLVILDGAHNRDGMVALGTTLVDEFPEGERVLVVGIRGLRDVADMLEPLAGIFRHVVATSADDAAAIDPDVVAQGARTALGEDVTVVTEPSSAQAMVEAQALVGEDDMVVVAGSLYLVGEVRKRLH